MIEIISIIRKGQIEGVNKKDPIAEKEFVESLFHTKLRSKS